MSTADENVHPHHFQMYFGLIEGTLASRLNIEKPAPRLMRSSAAITRKDHASPVFDSVPESRSPTTNNTSHPNKHNEEFKAGEPIAGSNFEVLQDFLNKHR
jgi:hypothetical protein